MIIYLIFIIIGGLLLAFASAKLMNRLAFLRHGERAMGTFIEFVEHKDDDGTFYFPVFNIPYRREEIITYKHWIGSTNTRWQTGDTALFIFEPGKPETIKPLNYRDILGGALLLLSVAVDLLVIGGGYFLFNGYFGM